MSSKVLFGYNVSSSCLIKWISLHWRTLNFCLMNLDIWGKEFDWSDQLEHIHVTWTRAWSLNHVVSGAGDPDTSHSSLSKFMNQLCKMDGEIFQTVFNIVLFLGDPLLTIRVNQEINIKSDSLCLVIKDWSPSFSSILILDLVTLGPTKIKFLNFYMR